MIWHVRLNKHLLCRALCGVTALVLSACSANRVQGLSGERVAWNGAGQVKPDVIHRGASMLYFAAAQNAKYLASTKTCDAVSDKIKNANDLLAANQNEFGGTLDILCDAASNKPFTFDTIAVTGATTLGTVYLFAVEDTANKGVLLGYAEYFTDTENLSAPGALLVERKQ